MRPGDIIADKYRIDATLGGGGMGEVVAATHLALGRTIAIKFLRPEVGRDPVSVARFLREARASARMESEHVCRVLDYGSFQGFPFIAMELLEGHTLAAELKRSGPLPVEKAADYLVQTCDAIGEAHALGIIHRDLKPANLFLAVHHGGAARIKVLDFGVSKALLGAPIGEKSLTEAHMMLGTPLYVSPEQLRNSKKVDARADVWSLGVILYQLLAGHPPFEHRSVDQLFAQIATALPEPLESLRDDIPPDLLRIVSRCLEKDADARFANAGELGLELSTFAPYFRPRFERLVNFARAPSWRPSQPASMLGVPTERPPTLRVSSHPPLERLNLTPSSLDPLTTAVGQRRKRRPSYLHAGAAAAASAAVVAGFVSLAFHPEEAPPRPHPANSVAAGPVTNSQRSIREDWVAIKIQATPANATLYLDGRPLTENPYVAEVPISNEPRTLEARAPGYDALERTVTFSADLAVHLALRQHTGVRRSPAAGLADQPRVSAPAAAAPATRPGADERRLDGQNPFGN